MGVTSIPATEDPQAGAAWGSEVLPGSRASRDSPSSGVKIGVQIHNTWLNPDVVSTYPPGVASDPSFSPEISRNPGLPVFFVPWG